MEAFAKRIQRQSARFTRAASAPAQQPPAPPEPKQAPSVSEPAAPPAPDHRRLLTRCSHCLQLANGFFNAEGLEKASSQVAPDHRWRLARCLQSAQPAHSSVSGSTDR